MATLTVVNVTGSNLGTGMSAILSADDIQFGDQPSYQVCKDIYLYHPLGAKIAEKPLEIAQSQKRNIVVADSPGTRAAEEFERTWKKICADSHIFNTMAMSRVYGIASIAMLTTGQRNEQAVDFKKLYKMNPSWNVYDPLNTAGSLVLDQNPLSKTFQQVTEIAVSGSSFHRSRTKTVMNERPMYIVYQSSAFGFSGRSVYQRSLYALKSFIQTMQTDDMVSVKAGVIIAKIKQAGSIINNRMRAMLGLKRDVVREARVGNVISISSEGETIESIDLKNLDGPFAAARKNIIENIASATPMPAKMLTNESFALGHADGTEDAKEQARYVDRVREQMEPLYEYFDKIVQHLAWNAEWLAALRQEMPEWFEGMDDDAAFYRFQNSFKAEWPSFLKEPDSELSKIEKVRLEGVISLVEALMPLCKGENKAMLVKWAADNFNEFKLLFGSPLHLDYKAIEEAPEPVIAGS